MRLREVVADISSRVMEVTAARSQGRTRDLVVEHELAGVTPEMIDWWWDNINDTERYRLWHPGSHISFTWEVKKEGDHTGKVQRVVEKIGPVPVALRIRWEEPEDVPIRIELPHVNAASVIDGEGDPISWLVHQYEAMEGGTRMLSTFRLPGKTPGWFLKGLKKHNREEMAQFTGFLPELFKTETEVHIG